MKNILLKERIKLKSTLIVLSIIHICAVVYFVLSTRSWFIAESATTVWSTIITKNVIYFDDFKNLLLATGLGLGIMQFYSETASKRFRISCHLPVTEFKMTSSLLFFGFISITIFWLLDALAVYIVSRIYFPSEIYSQTFILMFYWYMGALTVYAYASILTLEPSWVYKGIFGVILAKAILLIEFRMFYPENIYMLIVAFIAVVYMLIFYYPALRFRMGE